MFEWRLEWEEDDLSSGKTDLARTTEEVTKAMSSLVSYLVFEGEEAGMFSSGKLPTLDTSIWWNGSQLKFEFYEKPMCPNRVLQRHTALSDSSIIPSLNQYVFRRMMCCSIDLPEPTLLPQAFLIDHLPLAEVTTFGLLAEGVLNASC